MCSSDLLRNFSFALLVGLLSGGVSSILIAAPLAAIWKEHQPEGRKRAKKASKRAAREAAPAYDSDVVDVDVLARAEAALHDEPQVPSLMRDDEPDAEVEVPDAEELVPEPEPEAEAPAPAAEAPAPAEGDDVGAGGDAPAPPPKRERRHSQVKRRKRS